MAPCFDNETVYFASYDGCVYGYNLKIKENFHFFFNSNNHQQSINGIRSTPLIYENSLILATLSGWILSLNKVFFILYAIAIISKILFKFIGRVIWSIFVKDPIFANVTRLFDTNLACVITVRGLLILFNMDSGIKVI